MEFDAKTKQFTVDAVPTLELTGDGTTQGVVIDTQLFESLTFSLIVHTLANTLTLTLLLEAADDLGFTEGVVTVLEADDPKTLIGTLKGLIAAGEINRVGYIGKKRFVRASIVATDAASVPVALVGVIAIQANAQNGPTEDQ